MTTNAATRYRYQALRPDGSRVTGSLAAESEPAARAGLTGMGLWVTHVESQSTLGAPWRGASSADIALFFELLAGLLESGLTLPRSLSALAEFAPARTQPLALEAASAIREGRSFGAAIHGARVMAPEVSSLIRAGEASGALAVSVRGAATLLIERTARRRALQGALAYPALLLASSSAAVVVMVGMVLPRFTAMLGELGQELPPVTRFVVGASAAFRALALPVVALGAVVVVVLARMLGTADGRRRIHSVLLRVPFVGPLRAASASSRLTSTLGALLAQGLPMRPALTLAVTGSGDAAVMVAAEAAIAAVVRGERPSRALAHAGAVSRRAAHLLAAGEESGRLAELAQRAGRLDAEWVDRRLALMLRIVEPALILGFAGVVGLIAAAMLQAVYAIRPTS